MCREWGSGAAQTLTCSAIPRADPSLCPPPNGAGEGGAADGAACGWSAAGVVPPGLLPTPAHQRADRSTMADKLSISSAVEGAGEGRRHGAAVDLSWEDVWRPAGRRMLPNSHIHTLWCRTVAWYDHQVNAAGSPAREAAPGGLCGALAGQASPATTMTQQAPLNTVIRRQTTSARSWTPHRSSVVACNRSVTSKRW